MPEACSAVIKEVETRQPDAAAARFYRKAHRQYQRLYPTLKDTFPRLAKLI